MKTKTLNVFLMGLDPLGNLTPIDGILESIRWIDDASIRIIGVADDVRQSAVAMVDAFDDIMVIEGPGDDRIRRFIDSATRYDGLKLVIPARNSDLEELCTARVDLQKNGIAGIGVSIAQMHPFLQGGSDLLDIVPGAHTTWHCIESETPDETQLEKLDYPVKLTSLDRTECKLCADKSALQVYLERSHRTSGKPMLARSIREESAFQASCIMNSDGMPIEWTLVRELSNDPCQPAWMFMDVDDEELEKRANEIAAVLNCRGPVTISFTRSDASRSYEFDTIRFLLPCWCALPASYGVNLVEQLISTMTGRSATSRNPPGPRGRMIVFNSFDVPISSETWLKRITPGGR